MFFETFSLWLPIFLYTNSFSLFKDNSVIDPLNMIIPGLMAIKKGNTQVSRLSVTITLHPKTACFQFLNNMPPGFI